MIRVLLADDQPLVRAGFRLILDAEDGITVVGEADDGAAALALARQERPDLVLMDIRMPGLDGIEATRQIAADGAAGQAVQQSAQSRSSGGGPPRRLRSAQWAYRTGGARAEQHRHGPA